MTIIKEENCAPRVGRRINTDGDGYVLCDHDEENAFFAFDSEGELIGEFASRALAEKVLSLAAIARRARGRDKIEAVIKYMNLLCYGTRVSKVLPLIEHEPPEIFWPIFIEIWPYSYCDHTHDWKRLLAALQQVGPHHSVRHLPKALTVYRGGSRSHIAGLSWTTNLEVARNFARGIGWFAVPDPVVATARIKRSDVFWYSNRRREHEVICWPTVRKLATIDAPARGADRVPGAR